MDMEKLDQARRLDSIVWALFLIWSGIALIANVGWGYGVLGVAAIILGGEAYRWHRGLEIQTFWLIFGVMALAVAIMTLFSISLRLIPLVLIGFGIGQLLGVIRRPRPR